MNEISRNRFGHSKPSVWFTEHGVVRLGYIRQYHAGSHTNTHTRARAHTHRTHTYTYTRLHLSGICAYFQKAINNSAPTLAPTNTRVPIQTPSVPPLFAPTVATASPGANAGYYDVWCGDQNLIAETDTTNTERNVTWGACSNRCTANAACNYFLWGVVTYLGVYPVNRCALFVNCDTRTAYLDGDPYVYVTERVAERTPF